MATRSTAPPRLTIWSIALAGGDPHRIHTGESVAMIPAGLSLLIEMIESGKKRLLEVKLSDGGKREVPLKGPFNLANAPVASSGIRDGKLAASLALLTWFYQPGVVHLATGRITAIPVDFQGDFHFEGWTGDGHMIAWPTNSDPLSGR